MLSLFRSIFLGNETSGRYPKSLLDEAIERAVDGTDPWLRGLSGYRRKLRPAVLTALDHVMNLVEGLAPPRSANRDGYAHDPLLQAMFLSSAQMLQLLHGLLQAHAVAGGAACALLMMDLEQRGIFGADLHGDMLVRDVPQVTVSFANHRLLDPCSKESETRRLLKRRAFDHLLSLALHRMATTKETRKNLDNRHALLQAKLDILQNGNWGFDPGTPQRPDMLAELGKQLADNESQLQLVGSDDSALEVAMQLLVEVLGRPQQHLWADHKLLAVDRMGIKRATASDTAPELQLEQLHNAEGRSVVVTLVTIET
jgi:hypothetical protein